MVLKTYVKFSHFRRFSNVYCVIIAGMPFLRLVLIYYLHRVQNKEYFPDLKQLLFEVHNPRF